MASRSYGSMSPRVPIGVAVASDGTELGVVGKILPPYAEVTQVHVDLNLISDSLGASSHAKFGQYNIRLVYGEIPVYDDVHTMNVTNILYEFFPRGMGQIFEGDGASEVEAGLLGQNSVTPNSIAKRRTLWNKTEVLGLPSNAILIGDATIAYADKIKMRVYPNKKRGFRKPRRESFKFLGIGCNTELIATSTDAREMLFGDSTGDFETLVSAFEAALISPTAQTGDGGLTGDAEDYLKTGNVAAGLASEAQLNLEGYMSFTAEYYKPNPGGRAHFVAV